MPFLNFYDIGYQSYLQLFFFNMFDLALLISIVERFYVNIYTVSYSEISRREIRVSRLPSYLTHSWGKRGDRFLFFSRVLV